MNQEFAISNPKPLPSKQLNPLIIVGKTKKNATHKYGYKDVQYDVDGWADTSKYIPAPYDLCVLKTDNKTMTGWHTGQIWDGLNIKEKHKILYWKRLIE